MLRFYKERKYGKRKKKRRTRGCTSKQLGFINHRQRRIFWIGKEAVLTGRHHSKFSSMNHDRFSLLSFFCLLLSVFLVLTIHRTHCPQEATLFLSFWWNFFFLYISIGLIPNKKLSRYYIYVMLPIDLWRVSRCGLQKNLCQWRCTPRSPKPVYYWNLTIRLFSVIFRTHVEWGLTPSAEKQSVYSTAPPSRHRNLSCVYRLSKTEFSLARGDIIQPAFAISWSSLVTSAFPE